MSESLVSQVEETKVSDEDGAKEKAEVSTAKDSAGSAMEVDTEDTGGQQPEQGDPGDKEKSATVDINARRLLASMICCEWRAFKARIPWVVADNIFY